MAMYILRVKLIEGRYLEELQTKSEIAWHSFIVFLSWSFSLILVTDVDA